MMSAKFKVDVIIIGGGMAGVTAAIAASRWGANVLLAEEGSYLGGTSTRSMLGELNGYTHRARRIYGGVTAEIIDNMVRQGFAFLKYSAPMTGNPSILVDRVRYEPERLKIFLDELLIEKKVAFLLHSTFARIEEASGSTYKVSLTNEHECIEVEAAIVIDASGNADVVHKANKPTWKESKEDAQAVSLIFRMSGVDTAAFQKFSMDELRKMILTGNEQGFLPAKYCAINPIAETNDAIINMTRISEVDHESMADMTRAEIEGRKQISKAIPYLKKNCPGFGKAYLSGIAPSLGIRDARRIIGRYTLTKEDILSGKKFKDAVAIGCYPMDIHGKKDHSVDFTAVGGDGIYTIPFSSLLPNEMERVIVAGKCISADSGAFAAIRTVPTVMAIGEAAGTAAALSIKDEAAPHHLPVDRIQAILKKQGHLL